MKRLLYIIISLCIIFSSHAVVLASEEGQYLVGIGDMINITVVGHSDLTRNVNVAIDGTIAFPHLGTIYVKDKTLHEIETEITQKLREGYLQYPIVSVSLVSSFSKKVFVNAQGGGGAIPFEKDLSVLKALSLLRGVGENNLYGKIKVRRKLKGGEGYEVIAETKLNKGQIEESKVEDMLLEPDDIIIIEPSETFFVRGEVPSSGRFVLEDGITVSRAITLAGGISEYALHGKINVRRKKEASSGYYDLVEVALDDGNIIDREVEDLLLQPDDILHVMRAESYYMQGEVTVSGKYLLEYGITAGRAITLAGGITEGGMYGNIKVRRRRTDGPGYDDIEINIEGIIKGDETSDIALQSDDILIVERNRTYIVYGEVNGIGEFPIKTDTTIFKAILASNGFNKWGSESRVKILRPTKDGKELVTIKVDINDILDGDATANIALQPGDIVVVSSGLF